MKRILLLLLALIAIPSAANAQAKVISTCGTIPASFATLVAGAQSGYWMDTNGNLCVNASVTATVTGFAPGGAFANLTATGSSADVALPSGAVVAAQNTGTTAVSCNFTVGAGSASASQNIIQPGSTVYFTVGTNTHGSCIDQTGSASNVVVFSGGAGLGTGFGGGGGGSGGGLAVTDNTAFTYGTSQLTPIGGVYNSSITALTSGDQGAVALTATRSMHTTPYDSAGTDASDTTNHAVRVNVVAGGAGGGAVYGPTANGSPAANPPVLMGGTVDGTATGNVANAMILPGNTAGTTNPAIVVADPNLLAAATSQIPAGTNLIGKVGIDQTTPGTTNGVQVNAALPAGTNVVGYTSADPCSQAAKTNLPITSNTSALTQIIAASGSTKVYICSMALISASAEWITFNTGTGTNCGTSTAGLIGGTTVGTNGLSLAANGGLTLGNGQGTVAVTGAGGEVCVALSSTTYVTGNLTYVQQ